MEVKIFESVEELNRFAADKFIEIGSAAIEMRGQFSISLSGGSTPKALYQLLSSEKFKDKIDWKKVFFFFGDERNVLPDSAESNFRMADDNLFQTLNLPDKHIFRWPTDLGDENKIAEEYEIKIRNFFDLPEKSFPSFDLILLGMGDDGHTASLFPNTNALTETERIAVANWVEKLSAWRFTLTFPVINNAENVIFLVKGEDKAATLREVLEGDFQPRKLPSQSVKPTGGNLFWLADSTAAKLLSREN